MWTALRLERVSASAWACGSGPVSASALAWGISWVSRCLGRASASGRAGRRFLRKQVRLRSHQLFHALPTPSLLHAPASSTGRLVGAARDEHDCQRQAHGCPLVLTRPAPSLHAADARRWRREMPFATALSNLSRCWSHRFVSHHVGCRWRPRFRAVVVCALPIRVGRCPEGCSSAAIGDFASVLLTH